MEFLQRENKVKMFIKIFHRYQEESIECKEKISVRIKQNEGRQNIPGEKKRKEKFLHFKFFSGVKYL